MDDDYKMYVVVNQALGMRSGKVAAQVGHAVSYIVRHLERSQQKHLSYRHWIESGERKIILKASSEQIVEILEKHTKHCIPVYDEGRTQIPSGSLTCVGFFPTSEQYEGLASLKLL